MSAADFFTRLDAHLGAFTFKSLEKAAGLGENTLAVARRRDSVPKLETTATNALRLGFSVSGKPTRRRWGIAGRRRDSDQRTQPAPRSFPSRFPGLTF